MRVIRTPDERFKDLPGFPFTPHYVEINGLRIHYVDEGEGDVILCLHGVPTWSYLYRKMIPVLARRRRVLAMDFVGFGRSDKLIEMQKQSFRLHCDILAGFVDKLDLNRITLVGHDLGAVVGLWMATQQPARFDRLVIMNSTLPTGERPLNFTMSLWKQFVDLAQDVPVGRVIRMGLSHGAKISKKEIAAYEAPFPDVSYKAGPVAIPLSLPVQPNDPGAPEIREVRDALSHWHKPALVLFSNEDPIYRGEDKIFRDLIPSANQQPKTVIEDAGHFLPEEKGEEIAANVAAFIERTPVDKADRVREGEPNQRQ